MRTTADTNDTPSSLLLQAGRAWLDDHCASLGAALACYTLFSLAPLLLIVVSIGGLVFGEEAARGQLGQELQGLLASTRWPAGSLMSTVVALAVMLVGATTVFAELQNTLDHIWRAPAPATSGLWSLLRSRVLSFGLVLGVGFLPVVSLVLVWVYYSAQMFLFGAELTWVMAQRKRHSAVRCTGPNRLARSS